MKRMLIISLALLTNGILSFPARAASSYTCLTYGSTQFPNVLEVYPTGINDAGAVVGTYATKYAYNLDFTYGGIVSFLRDSSGNISFLQYPEAVTTWAYTINNAGQIAGTYQDSENNKHGFIRNASGTFVSIDLPAAPPGLSWDPTKFWVYGINDSGELSGITADPNPSPGQLWHFIRNSTGQFQFFDPVTTDLYSLVTYYPLSAGPINNSGALLETFEALSSEFVPNRVRNPDGSFTTVDYPPGDALTYPLLSGLSNSGLIAGFMGSGSANPIQIGFTGQYTGGGLPAVACNPDSSSNANIKAFAVNDGGAVSGVVGPQAFGFVSGLIAIPTGLSSNVALSNTSWQFANHPVGQTSGPGTIYLTSNGTADLNIQAVTINSVPGNDYDQFDFAITSTTCVNPGPDSFSPQPKTIPVGQTCQIVFDFTPSLAGERNAEIVITDDTPQAPHVVSIRGAGLGPGLVLSNYSWNFTPGLSAPQSGTVYAYNPGTQPTVFSSISIQGLTASDFTFQTTCGSELAAYATCSVTFTLVPGALAGSANATLTFVDNVTNNSTQGVILTNN